MSRPTTEQASVSALVVGEPGLAAQLREAGVDRIVEVDHYLDALGELARRPVACVVGGLRVMSDGVDATVRALREAAPHTRLLLVADADREPEAMRGVRLGADDYLVRPIHPRRVILAMENASQAAPVPPRPSDPSPPPATARPGFDLPLVEQLMRDPPGLRELALRLIREHLGHEDLRWSDPPIEAPGVACVPVRFSGRILGRLVSRTLTPDQLGGYAEWLAHWLALQQHITHLNDMALRDELTGAWNRRYFEFQLRSILRRAERERFRITLMIYDIDDFKSYNDRFGHAAGDEILSETAKLMRSLVRDHDVVARIGGDEFAVLFWDAEEPRQPDSAHPKTVREAAFRFRQAVADHHFPKLARCAPGTLTISGGLAGYPGDGRTPEQLVEAADRMLLESKGQGKNAITFGPEAGLTPASTP